MRWPDLVKQEKKSLPAVQAPTALPTIIDNQLPLVQDEAIAPIPEAGSVEVVIESRGSSKQIKGMGVCSEMSVANLK